MKILTKTRTLKLVFLKFALSFTHRTAVLFINVISLLLVENYVM